MDPEDVRQLTYSQCGTRLRAIEARLVGLSAKHRLSRADEAEHNRLADESLRINAHRQRLERGAELARGAGGGRYRLEGEGDGVAPYADNDRDTDRDNDRGLDRGLRSAAMNRLDSSVKNGLPAGGAEVCEQLITTGPDVERSWMARWIRDSGNPDYKSAFAKILMHGEQRAGLEFTPAEREAFTRVTRLKAEQRSMSLTDTAGGYLVPFEVDFAVNLTSSGSINPLLEISRVISTVSDVWHGISSSGVTSEWLGEGSEAADATPALNEPAIPAYKMSAFAQYSVELQLDAPSLLEELGILLSDSATQLLNTALTTGSGSFQPRGVITALAGTSSVVNTATGATLVAGDVFNLQSSLAPRFQGSAQFCASLNVWNMLRQLVTGSVLTFPELRDDPPRLLSRNANELSNMDTTVASGKNIIVYGDFSQYVVTRRVGSIVEPIPWIMGANNRPVGKRGVWFWSRWGADVLVPNAFRVLTA
jgi:HK97 family phage major capsid protein